MAILYSHDANEALNDMPFNRGGSPWSSSDNNYYTNTLVKQFHKICYQNNIGIDFIFPHNAEFSKYKVIIIPSLYIATDELLKQISDYVKNGGHIIMQFKSGFCDENTMVRPMLAPGPLREVSGFYYQEFSNIKELSLKDDPFKVGKDQNKVHTWMEYLITDSAKPLAYYEHDYFSEFPAITKNKFGKGTLTYEGCMVSDSIQEKIILQTIDEAGIMTPEQTVKWPLIIKSGTNQFNKTIRYYYNYSSKPQVFVHSFETGKELLSGKKVEKNSDLAIEPWGVLIIEE